MADQGLKEQRTVREGEIPVPVVGDAQQDRKRQCKCPERTHRTILEEQLEEVEIQGYVV